MKSKSVIRQLLLESPCSMDRIEMNEEQGRIMDVLIELEKQINEKYGGDEATLNLFRKLEDALDDLCYEDLCCYFERGVKFGVKFGMELAEE